MRKRRYRQLTIDGREVRHPPPRPRVICPDCGRPVLVTVTNCYRLHLDLEHEPCPAGGRHYAP